MNFSATDHAHMATALRLAERGLMSTDPNPRVGCVLVADGTVVGRGWHRRAGEPHAEALALSQAGARARGATCYVTLEPCAHQGRTGPCARALIEAGVKRVIAAMLDPDPRTAGKGFRMLAQAGIETRSGLLESSARALNVGFVSRHERQRPWVRVKLAVSLDGRTAAADGSSQWITSPAAREDVQQWRGRAGAVLTGIGTVIADDPGMNLRQAGVERQPLRVVVDSRARTPRQARLVGLPGPVLIATTGQPVWQADQVDWLTLPADDHGRVDLDALLGELVRREVNELHVEAGPTLSGALMESGLVDELLVYQAPCLLGNGRPLALLPGVENIDGRLHLEPIDAIRVGPDWRLRYRAARS